jgi:ankyrin repeat protein
MNIKENNHYQPSLESQLRGASIRELGLIVTTSIGSRLNNIATDFENFYIKCGFKDIELAQSALQGDVLSVKKLCALGVNPAAFGANIKGWTPLHRAIQKNDEEMTITLINEMLKHDAKTLNYREDTNLRTPLHVAAINSNWSAYKSLLKTKRSNPNIPDIDLVTPMAIMAKTGTAESMEISIKCGGNVNIKDKSGLPIAFHVIAGESKEKIQMLEVLKNNGFDLNKKYGFDEINSLSYAAKYANKEVVAYLLEQPNADVNSMNKHGLVPLHFAGANSEKGITQVLMNAGAQVNVFSLAQPEKGIIASTPLIYASAKGNLDAVECLTLNEKTNLLLTVPGTKDTALDYAKSRNQIDIIQLLESRISDSKKFERSENSKSMVDKLISENNFSEKKNKNRYM